MNCLEHLEICKASCCRSFTFFVKPDEIQFYKKGETIRMPIKLNEDQSWYFKLHGCTYAGGFLTFVIKDAKAEGDKVWILNECLALEGNLCRIHPIKPKACMELDETTIKSNRFSLTENCLLSNFRD